MSDVNEGVDLEVGGKLGLEASEDEVSFLTFEGADTELEALLDRDEDECMVRLRIPLNETELLWLWDAIREAKERL